MRQAGILAAACLHALDHHLPLLALDHDRARRFAAACAATCAVTIHPEDVDTNMVMIDFRGSAWTPEHAQALLAEHQVIIGMGPAGMLRAVFHLDITDAEVDRAIGVMVECFGGRF